MAIHVRQFLGHLVRQPGRREYSFERLSLKSHFCDFGTIFLSHPSWYPLLSGLRKIGFECAPLRRCRSQFQTCNLVTRPCLLAEGCRLPTLPEHIRGSYGPQFRRSRTNA
jgi:hypothetical protein